MTTCQSPSLQIAPRPAATYCTAAALLFTSHTKRQDVCEMRVVPFMKNDGVRRINLSNALLRDVASDTETRSSLPTVLV